MSFYYAQIDENNICYALSQLAAEMNNSNLIQIDEFNFSILGKIWNGSDWLEPPQEN